MEVLLLLLNLTAALFLTGLIWFVQLVHYPLFAHAGRTAFPDYETEHTRRTTLVVAPAMLVEAGASLAMAVIRSPSVSLAAAWGGLALVVLIWLSTAFLQVPQHRSLMVGFSAAAHRKLVFSNWVRTAGWTARSGLLLWCVSRELQP